MALPTVTTETDLPGWVDITNVISADLGDPSLLPTGASGAISNVNLLNAHVGSTGALETTDQSSVVAALNEVKNTAVIMAIVLSTPLN